MSFTPRDRARLDGVPEDQLIYYPDDPDGWSEGELQEHNGNETAPDAPRRTVTLVPAASVRTKRVRWLMDSWIPVQSITLLAGREGLGKSTIACDIAAQATRGELNAPPMNVAYLNTEDSRAMTVKPRLQAAGADLGRVFFFDVFTETGSESGLQLPGDTSLLARALVEADVKLVILDAAKSAMHTSLDGYRDDDVRQFLEPLASMCDQHGITILGLTHFGKRESKDPGKLILGSVAWSQIARSVLSVAVNDEGTLVVTNTKGNLAPAQISREARIESVTIPTDDGDTADVGRIVWGDNTSVSAADLLGDNGDQDDERTDAEMIVIDYLESQGGSASAGDIRKQIMAAGLTWKTVQNNRRKWGVRTEQHEGGWVWSLEAGPAGTSRAREGRDLGSGQVRGYISGPERGQVPDPTCTGDSRDLGSQPREAEGPLPVRITATPRARGGGPTGPTGADLHKQDGPTGEVLQLGHTHVHDPTGDPTVASVTRITPKPPMNPVDDTNVEDTVIGCLHPEHGMSLATVQQSTPSAYRDQVEACLEKLLTEGRVARDSHGRYLLATA